MLQLSPSSTTTLSIAIFGDSKKSKALCLHLRHLFRMVEKIDGISFKCIENLPNSYTEFFYDYLIILEECGNESSRSSLYINLTKLATYYFTGKCLCIFIGDRFSLEMEEYLLKFCSTYPIPMQIFTHLDSEALKEIGNYLLELFRVTLLSKEKDNFFLLDSFDSSFVPSFD
jgi:hypothetical protein